MNPPIGVLVMAYGGPDSLADVEPYLMDVRGGRETPPHLVEEVRERYARIGGRSPILERTMAQADALQAALAGGPGSAFRTVIGMRHWQPRIRDALTALEAGGVERAIGLVMAPHFSRMSVGAYQRVVEEARSPVEVRTVPDWHLLPGYLAGLADRITGALGRFPDAVRDRVHLLFTAHSLPERILQWDDPYPRQLRETVAAVMGRLGPRSHAFAFQSAGMSGEPWLGPDAAAVVEDLARDGVREVLVVPVGFVCDHVEVLFDLDLELRPHAASLGVSLERIEMLNDHPALVAGLAALVRDAVREAGWA